MKTIVLAAAMVALSGCASGVKVMYDSDPQGATLYQNGQPVGMTPYTLTYQNAVFNNGFCFMTAPMEWRWASGATYGPEQVRICPEQGRSQRYAAPRPMVPGREIDANFAMQRYQAAAAQQAAGAAAFNAMLLQQSQQMLNPPRPAFAPLPPEPIRCTSTRMGPYTNTTCQ